MKKGDLFVVGFDKIKERTIIQDAYSNSNRPMKYIAANLVKRINREFQGTIDPSLLTEHSYYDPIDNTIKAMIVSKADQKFLIKGQEF